MDRRTRRRQTRGRKKLKEGEFCKNMTEVPRDQWPDGPPPPGLFRLLVSDGLIVQVCTTELPTWSVLMIQRKTGKPTDVLTWDVLQEVKAACGYGACEAVEIYPPDDNVVNVANMRHLWLLPPNTRMPVRLDPRG